MRQPVAEVVGVPSRENLGLCLEAAESSRVNDPIAVALKVVAVGMLRLGVTAPAGLFHAHRIISEHGESLKSRFQCFKEVVASRRSPANPKWLMTGDWRLATVLRFFRLLAGQSHFGRFEFLLHAGKEIGVHFGRDRLVPVCDGTLPVSDREF